jgi:hypothetical protein
MIIEQAEVISRPLETERKFARLVGWVAGGLFLLVFALQAIALS